jgi:PadR family transcriptional regulator PadR
MKGTQLGEFEELALLTVGVLQESAYGVGVKEEIELRSNRKVTLSTVHATLIRLEEKGFLESVLGEATKERGGKRKRIFKMTSQGGNALVSARELRNDLWSSMPKMTFSESFSTLKSAFNRFGLSL